MALWGGFTSFLASSPHPPLYPPPPPLPGETPSLGEGGWRTRHLLYFQSANVSCCSCPWCHPRCQPLAGKPQPWLCTTWGQAGGNSPLLGPAINWTAAALKKCVCSLAGCRAGGSGESWRTPAEILYSWGRLAFSTRQDPLPCSNIPSLPLGKPADEISIAVTPAKPFPGAWEGSRAASQHGQECKEGCSFRRASPGTPSPRMVRGCLGAGWSLRDGQHCG